MPDVQEEQREQVDERKLEQEAERQAEAEVGEGALREDAKNARAEQLGAAAATGPSYTVVEGDTLSAIARRFLGDASRWPEIRDLNEDTISDPDLIHPGQVFQLPAGADRSAAEEGPSAGKKEQEAPAGGKKKAVAGAAGAAVAAGAAAGAIAGDAEQKMASPEEIEEEKKGPRGKAPTEEESKKRAEEEKKAEQAKSQPPPKEGIPQAKEGEKAKKGPDEKAPKKAKGGEDAGGKKGGGDKKGGGSENAAEGKEEKAEDKAGEGKFEEPAPPSAQDAPIPRLTPEVGQNATVDPPIPSSFQETEAVVAAGEQATAQAPEVQPENARKQGFGGVIKDALLVGTLGPLYPTLFFDKNIASIPDKLTKSWEGFGEGGWQTAYASINGTYSIVDIITSITGPLGSALAILGYSRYIPIPPVAAFGAWATTIGKVLQGITFILDIVKMVLSALKLVVGACAAAFAKDPKIRKKFAENLLADTVQFASNGIAVGVGAMTAGQWRAPTSGGAQASRGILGSAKRAVTTGIKANADDALTPLRSGGMQSTFSGIVANATDDAALVAQEGASGALARVAGGSRSTRASLLRRAPGAMLHDIVKPDGRLTNAATTVVTKGVEEPARSEKAGGPGMKTSDLGATGESVVESLESGRAGEGAKTAASAAAMATPATAIMAAPVVAGSGIADWLESRSTGSLDTLSQQAQGSSKPLTKTPFPPAKVQSAPAQKPAVAAQKQEMQKQAKDLEEQKLAAKAGQEEAEGLGQAADKHKMDAEKSAAGAQKGKLQTTKDKQAVAQDKQKVKKGKAESRKGKAKFGEAEGKGNEGKGGAPADASSSDVPWYKKPFVWVISKINAGKRKITNMLTKMIMKAIAGATGMEDLDGKLEEADSHVGEQEQALTEEPGKFDQAAQTWKKEAADAARAKADADARKAKNQAVEQKADKALADTKAQEQKLSQNEQKIDADATSYEATYGPAYREMDELADKQEEGDFTPMELSLDEQVAVVSEGVDKLEGAMAEHRGQMTEAAEQRQGAVVGELAGREDVGPEGVAEASERTGSVKEDVLSKTGEQDAERKARVQAIRSEAAALKGQPASKERVEQVAKLQGELVGEARGFEESRQTEMEALHESFAQAYSGMVGLGEAA
ncbi:MAG: LysM peptidoglycan-binding domain-containing protein [Myxococcota bacterium]